jgi:class 3 adenylate cyclase/tetratricopeptide (TPR) repeat protein
VQGLLPWFVDEKIEAHQWSGEMEAVVVFADLVGFSQYTIAKMDTSGNEGVEAIAAMLNGVFGEASRIIHDKGGFIPYFAGDAFAGIFIGDVALFNALEAAVEIRNYLLARPLDIRLRTGIGRGPVEWVITPDKPHRWYFRGEGIRTAVKVQEHCPPMEIALDPALITALRDTPFQFATQEGVLILKADPSRIFSGEALHPRALLHVWDTYPSFLQDRLAGAEIREVTTLFIVFPDDISNEALGTFLPQCCRYIEEGEGYFKEMDFTDKGGLLVAFFGAPVQNGVSRQSALGAAMACMALLKEKLPVRMGLASGRAFCGLVGDEHRRQYMVSGRTINLAARLALKAQMGEILCEGETLNGLHIQSEAGPILKAKGFKDLVQTYRPIAWMKDSTTGKKLYRSPQVVDQLKSLIQTDKPKVTLITGEAGMGKTFLAKYTATATADQFSWLIIVGDAMQQEPFSALYQAMDKWFMHHPAIEVESRLQQIRILQANPDIAPKEKYARIKLAFRDLFRRQLDQLSVAVLLEQVQALDSGSREVFLDAQGGVPCPVLMTARTQQANELVKEFEAITVFELGPLNAQELGLLCEQKLQGKVSAHLVEVIHQTTNGNPFYAEQCLLFLQQKDWLLLDADQHWDMVAGHQEIQSSLGSILLARIDQLDREVVEVLKLASVIGLAFEVPVLHDLSARLNVDILDIEDSLSKGSKADIVESLDKERAGFRHQLLHEVVYALQMPGQLKTAHRQIVEILETREESNLNARLLTLAHHCKAGGLTQKAVDYFEAAGDKAHQQYQNREAIAYYKEAADLTTESAERLGMILKQIPCLIALGEWVGALEVLADPAFSETTDARIKAEHLFYLGQLHTLTGIYPEAEAYLNKSLAGFEALKDIKGMARCSRELSILLFRQGKYVEARQAIEATYQMLPESIQNDHALTMNLALIKMNLGEYEAAEELLYEELFYRHQTGEQIPLTPLYVNLGVVQNEAGRWEKALENINKGYQLAVDADNTLWQSIALGTRGMIFENLNDFDKAESDYEADLALTEKIKDPQGQAIARELLGNLRIKQGQLEEAKSHLEIALALSRNLHYQKGMIKSLLGLAGAAFLQGDQEAASSFITEGRLLANQLNNKRLEVQTALTRLEIEADKIPLEEAMTILNDVEESVLTSEDVLLKRFYERIRLSWMSEDELQIIAAESGLHLRDDLIRATLYASLWRYLKDDVHRNLAREAYVLAFKERADFQTLSLLRKFEGVSN